VKTEINSLMLLYPQTIKSTILENLPNRSWPAICRMASELKIHRMRGLDYVKGKLQRREITDFELGYLAGIIDGEGSICMHHRKNTFLLKFEIGNTFMPLRSKIHDLFGGGMAPGRITSGGKQSWIIYHSNAFAIYETLKLLVVIFS